MYYLGIDASTQGVKGVIIDLQAGSVVSEAAVNFRCDLDKWNAPHGYIENTDPLIRHADPRMWLDGLDLLLQRFCEAGAPMGQVAGICGSAQQHGSVYLNEKFFSLLENMDQAASLSDHFRGSFSRQTSPIWMDRSTGEECRELTEQFGETLQYITGSTAAERFTGPQIRKFFKDSPQNYAQTCRIHLVSSFLCSILCGKDSPMDYGDAAGMNLLDLRDYKWSPEITEFTAPALADKLPAPVGGMTVAGKLSPYFAKYNLPPQIPVTVWSGDNPSSLIGTGCAIAGTAAISLGTSDTLFAALDNCRPDPEGCGHVMGNPAGGYMNLICFTNGSLAREEMKKCFALSWEEFDRYAESAAPASGKLMLPYFQAESTPKRLHPQVVYNFDKDSAATGEVIRALLESQILSMKLHARHLGGSFRKIRLTGGASSCRSIRQIIADVFGVEVEIIQISNSAGLGAAMRSAASAGNISWEELFDKFTAPIMTVKPDLSLQSAYDAALQQYENLEKSYALFPVRVGY